MSRNIYEVVPSGESWLLREHGSKKGRVFATKVEAVERGRVECSNHRPSTLRIARDPEPRRGK